MRQIRECDFCGEGADGVYEPLPASIDPDGPRLVLCEDCHGRLAAVVAPLLDRVDDGASADAAGTDGAAGATTDGTAAGGAVDGDGNPASGATTEADANAGVDAGGRSGGEREGTPRGYRKVMRFFENRELPMAREEAERLAAEAYDLDADTVSAAVDHAIKYDRLREVRGELKR